MKQGFIRADHKMIVILHTDCTIIGLVSLLACAVTILPNAYAELPVWQVNITEGASRGGCENTFTCFEPAELYFIGDGIITWINRDTTVHTVMSNPEVDSPDPTISSNLIQPGEKFSYSFRQAGTWYYMCVIHPWMEGFVVIDEPPVRDAPSMVCASEKSEDGSIIVIARSTIPKAGEQLELLITFADDSGNYLEDVNWDFDVKQDGVGIFHETIAHGEIQFTDKLSSDKPLDIRVTLLGVGKVGDESNWTGLKGEVVKLRIDKWLNSECVMPIKKDSTPSVPAEPPMPVTRTSTPGIYPLSYEGGVYDIPYNITNGKISKMSMFMNGPARQTIVNISPEGEGTIELSLPQELFDPIDMDGKFRVAGGVTNYQDLGASCDYRKISFDFISSTLNVLTIMGLYSTSSEYGKGVTQLKAGEKEFDVATRSEGSICDLNFVPGEKKITFIMKGLKGTKTCHGIQIPNELVSGEFKVLVDGKIQDESSSDELLYCDPSPFGWRKDKFYSGFYEKILGMIHAGETRKYRTQITVTDEFKNTLADLLAQIHNATVEYKLHRPSYVVAGVPLKEILKLADYDGVRNIEDAEQYATVAILESNYGEKGTTTMELNNTKASEDITEFKIVRTETDSIITLELDFPTNEKRIEILGAQAISEFPIGSVVIIKPSPKSQITNGILPQDVTCKEGLQLIFKSRDKSPACVKPQTAQKLVERGWARSI